MKLKRNGLVRIYSGMAILDTLGLRYWYSVNIKKINTLHSYVLIIL